FCVNTSRRFAWVPAFRFRLPPLQSLADGVGALGEQEQSVTLVECPKATRSESEGQHSVTKRLKFGSKSPPRPGSVFPCEGWVFSANKSQAKCINNTDALTAETLLAADTTANGCAVCLAGIAPDEDVWRAGIWLWPSSHIVPSLDVGP